MVLTAVAWRRRRSVGYRAERETREQLRVTNEILCRASTYLHSSGNSSTRHSSFTGLKSYLVSGRRCADCLSGSEQAHCAHCSGPRWIRTTRQGLITLAEGLGACQRHRLMP